MNFKTKTFFEDIIIIFLIVSFIYGIYFLIFKMDLINFDTNTSHKVNKSNEIISTDISMNKIDNIDVSNVVEVIEKDPKINMPIKKIDNNEYPEIIENNISDSNETVIYNGDDINITDINQSYKIENEKPSVKTFENKNLQQDRSITLSKYLTKIREEISSVIANNQEKTDLNSASMKIRVTILKDGSCERVELMSGNKILFDLNKDNIFNIFPIKMNRSIENQFPRYYRLNITYKK